MFYFGHLHPSHESMISNPPDGFDFVSKHDSRGYGDFIKPPSYTPARRLVSKTAGRLFSAIGQPRRVPILARCDLLHIDGCAVPITTQRWMIGSIEYPSAFFSFDDTWYTRPSKRNSLLRSLASPKCRKILTLSSASLGCLRMAFGNDFKMVAEKTDVLYPAVPSRDISRRSNSQREDSAIRILFVGNHFFDKGGREVFRAFKRLRRKYDIELTLVTSVPPHHQSYYEAYRKILIDEPGVHLLSGIPKSVLWNDCFAKAHIFCFPSYMETFGYVLLEAMANRLPIVTTDEFAIPEIVRHGENGLTVHAPIAAFDRDRLRSPQSVKAYREAVLEEKNFRGVVDSLESSIAQLIEDDSLRERLAANSFQDVTEGRFSVSFRNRKLSEYYRQALG